MLTAVCNVLCYFCVFFFFKQKTAYEMRISDWSSDVCSSDLLCHAAGAGPDVEQLAERIVAQCFDQRLLDQPVGAVHAPQIVPFARVLREILLGGFIARRAHCRKLAPILLAFAGEARKGVVSGKTVSVRVERGGARILKKKKKR